MTNFAAKCYKCHIFNVKRWHVYKLVKLIFITLIIQR